MGAAYLRAPSIQEPDRLPCSGKIAFLTQKEANGQRRRVISRTRATMTEVYHCRHCGLWHLTTGRQWPGVGAA